MDKRQSGRTRTTRNKSNTPVSHKKGGGRQEETASNLYEYDIRFTFIPDVRGSKNREAIDLIKRFASRVEGNGWEVTPESLAISQSPSEHLEAANWNGTMGWITRLEVKRKFIKGRTAI